MVDKISEIFVPYQVISYVFAISIVVVCACACIKNNEQISFIKFNFQIWFIFGAGFHSQKPKSLSIKQLT